ncbi:MAG: bifunctional oligoribonuclease/PAP phosphatase NrnA [Candidatus Omnitrophica bacterium]|nr:bifunctional oligoribonuclease/PAP phosphatase NrnA [Candidatus Omnitrophota bacterium]
MKISKATKDKIKYFLKKHKNFLISAHTSPEGDSLGAQLAFARVIRTIDKNCDIVNGDKSSREYAFLPGIANIRTRPRIKKYDAAIILDCSDISRIGSVANFIDKNIPILNVDHHISNERFGDINLVNTDTSSTCEILYLLFKELNLRVDKFMAVCLYTGIVTDTGSFRYTNTSAMTHLVVSELLKWKIDVSGIFRNIYQNLNSSDLKLINSVLSNIKKDSTGKIAWVKIKQSLLKKYKPKIDLTDNILSFVRSIREVEACILFRERSGEEKNIRVNLRSRGKIDVNRIAQHFGGGGHRTASGITLRNTSLKKAETLIIDFIKNRIK